MATTDVESFPRRNGGLPALTIFVESATQLKRDSGHQTRNRKGGNMKGLPLIQRIMRRMGYVKARNVCPGTDLEEIYGDFLHILRTYWATPALRSDEDVHGILQLAKMTHLLHPSEIEDQNKRYQEFRSAWLSRNTSPEHISGYRNQVRTYVDRHFTRYQKHLVSKDLLTMRLDAFLQGLRVSQGYPLEEAHQKEQELLGEIIHSLNSNFSEIETLCKEGHFTYIGQVSQPLGSAGNSGSPTDPVDAWHAAHFSMGKGGNG
ncbi:hypothetical protein NPJ88_020415 [Halomonas elongata]|uniref:hypothetical protein n=1 Tax=Halomonas elongata TaxID=2746 RepID=UPI00255B3D5B|nr:hypothetical protein [Halomonas elongata]MDL4864697.1 hypothetical protein [Halomonas elongata]